MGLWKFNNSLLNDIEFVNAINNKIDENRWNQMHV